MTDGALDSQKSSASDSVADSESLILVDESDI